MSKQSIVRRCTGSFTMALSLWLSHCGSFIMALSLWLSRCGSFTVVHDMTGMANTAPRPCLFTHSQSHSHSLTITCTCCCDGIYGAQDLKISHAQSLILSRTLFLSYCFGDFLLKVSCVRRTAHLDTYGRIVHVKRRQPRRDLPKSGCISVPTAVDISEQIAVAISRSFRIFFCFCKFSAAFVLVFAVDNLCHLCADAEGQVLHWRLLRGQSV